MRGMVKAIAGRLGYRIERVASEALVDLRSRGNDPRSVVYHRQPVLVDLPMADGIGLHHFPLAIDGPHPFVTALRAASGCDGPVLAERLSAVLEGYYASVQPASAAEWLGLAAGESPMLDDQPPWA